MRRLNKMLAAAGIAALVALPVQQAEAYWWGGSPWYGGAWRHGYVYDPTYRWGSPSARRYIRDAYRYGPQYAQWRQYRRSWYGYNPWYGGYGW